MKGEQKAEIQTSSSMKLGTEQNEGKRQMEMIQLGAGRSYLGAYGLRRRFTAKPSKAQAASRTGGQGTAQGREIEEVKAGRLFESL